MRRLVALAALAAGVLVPGSASAQSDYALPQRPNIVFILADDLSSDLIKRMPAVRQLQADGVSFSRYIVSDSLCCPSRASIFTGRLPHNTQVMSNLPPFGGYEGFMSAGNYTSTFASSLRTAGYRTALMGKFMNGYKALKHPPLGGFDEWDATGSGYDQQEYTLNENGFPVHYGSARDDFFNTVLERKAQAFITEAGAAGLPFILEVSSVTPHFPYATAPEDKGSFPALRVWRGGPFNKLNRNAPAWLANRKPLNVRQRRWMDRIVRRRAAAVQSLDRLIRSVRDRLVQAGIADSTYVVFSSDNGFHAGEHRLLAGKQTAFDTDVRVPLIVAGPGIPAGQTTDVLAQNTDLRSTFEALAGRRLSTDVDGMSLKPWLMSPTLGGGRGAALVEHRRDKARPNLDPDAQTRYVGNPPDYTAIRLPDATYVEYDTGEREYYDNIQDPRQRTNLYDFLPRSRQLELAERLAALKACDGVECLAP